MVPTEKIDIDYSIKILVIEDYEPDFKLLSALLGADGEHDKFIFRLSNARTLYEALELLDKDGFDLILLDLRLPDNQSLDGLIEIRKRHGDLPVIILSGLDDKEIAMTSIAKGADNYIVKNNVSRKGIVEALEFALGRNRRDVTITDEPLTPEELLANLKKFREKRQKIAGQIRDAHREES